MDKIMNKIRLISWLVCLLFPFGYLQAQETHWNCNIADYEFDMTMYLNLQIDGQVVTNLKGYEVAAFCGEECRGIATVESIDGATDVSYYYLRVRSNQAKGESYVIKVYEKETGKEFTIDEKMDFVSQSVIGYPSTPKNLEYKNTYRLVFVVDGNVLVEQPLLWGSIVTVPQMPTKEGHTFSGWSEIPATMPASNITVTGSFSANSYKATYILDGETFKTETVVYGTAIPIPEVPAKPGYNFSGWGEVPATMPAQDLTFSGSYTINKDLKYNLVYMVDGVEYKRVTIAFGDVIVLDAAPVKEGHTFSGWSEVPETMPLHDVTVTGSFTANSYQLTYVLDGTTFKTETVVYGTAIAAPEAPAKEGYTFSGWSEIPETMPAKDVTVEGSFTVNRYTLLYMVDGAEYKTVELEYGTSIIAEAAPTKEGHTFSGWSEIPATMPAQDVTVTGSFTVNSYTITYKVDGEVYATEEVAYGEVIVLKEAPEKEGYIFSGWSEVPETMPAEDLEVTGSFASSIKAVITKTYVDVYSLQGMLLKRQILVDELKNELPQGLYIVDGKKVLVK